MRILVTGGCGLIGHNVVQRLEEQGHDVRIIDNQTDYGIIPADELKYVMAERIKKISHKTQIHKIDIESKFTGNVFEMFLPEIVIHLASFPRQKVVNANPRRGAQVMCEGLINLLELSVKHNVSKFVYISSSMIYGNFEDDVREDAICNPQGQYGIMKLAGEMLVRDYSRKHTTLTHTILRPSAVYGELDIEDRVISKFLLTAMRNNTIMVHGSNTTLDFTYVDDAADGIVSATFSDVTENKTYNITKSHGVKLVDAAKMTIDMVTTGKIYVGPRDLDFPVRGSLNVDAARQDFGFNPRIGVQEGFHRYYEWLRNSPFWQKKIKLSK